MDYNGAGAVFNQCYVILTSLVTGLDDLYGAVKAPKLYGLWKTVNNQCYNSYIFGKIFSSSSINVWVVALIVFRFEINAKKHKKIDIFLRLSRKRLTIHTFSERSFR